MRESEVTWSGCSKKMRTPTFDATGLGRFQGRPRRQRAAVPAESARVCSQDVKSFSSISTFCVLHLECAVHIISRFREGPQQVRGKGSLATFSVGLGIVPISSTEQMPMPEALREAIADDRQACRCRNRTSPGSGSNTGAGLQADAASSGGIVAAILLGRQPGPATGSRRVSEA
jgi:hypothetical protein